MLEIGRESIDQMIRHSEETYPRECCGVLVGTSDGTVRAAVEVHRTANLDDAHDRYVLDPRDLQRIDLLARSRNLDIVGIYHSHPDHPSEPSSFDFAHSWDGYSYIVVEVAGGKVASYRSWERHDGGFRREELRTP